MTDEQKLERRIDALRAEKLGLLEENRRLGRDSQKDIRIKNLNSQLSEAEAELYRIRYNNPEVVEMRQRTKSIEEMDAVKDERIEHEKEYEDLNILVKCLKHIGMNELANTLTNLRYIGMKSKSSYITREIELRDKEKSAYQGRITTKKEYQDIKRKVLKLPKRAKKLAKKYKDLSNLYYKDWEIIRDMKRKNIIEQDGTICYSKLESYFKSPHTSYYRDGSYRFEENLGYTLLEFYNGYDSKYRKDEKKGKTRL